MNSHSNLINYQHNDLNVITNAIKTYCACFVSPYSSFEKSFVYLKDLNNYLQQYIDLHEEEYRFCSPNTHVIPKLDFSQSFEISLYFACLQNNSEAQKTLELITYIEPLAIFHTKDFSYNHNPFYDILEEILNASIQLLNQKISHKDFFFLMNQNKDLLFPTFNEEIKDTQESSLFFDFNYMNDECIHYLKEKIYLNLLFDFIKNPQAYENSSYLFIDFLSNYSFNRQDNYSFAHLKEIFWRFEDTHWNTLKTLKNHILYNLIIDSLFIDNTLFVPDSDNDTQDYVYYFDFKSFNIYIKKNIILDDLFLCQATDHKNMQMFLHSIVKQNNYEPDNVRFNHLMIIYEKNKIENKLKPKNIHMPVGKI